MDHVARGRFPASGRRSHIHLIWLIRIHFVIKIICAAIIPRAAARVAAQLPLEPLRAREQVSRAGHVALAAGPLCTVAEKSARPSAFCCRVKAEKNSLDWKGLCFQRVGAGKQAGGVALATRAKWARRRRSQRKVGSARLLFARLQAIAAKCHETGPSEGGCDLKWAKVESLRFIGHGAEWRWPASNWAHKNGRKGGRQGTSGGETFVLAADQQRNGSIAQCKLLEWNN